MPPVHAGTVTLSRSAAAPEISPFAFGHNYWCWTPMWGDGVAGTESLIEAARVKLVRAGGFDNEAQIPEPFTNDELDQFVAYSRAIGAEPVLQVPLIKNAAGQPATAQDAADMVAHANVARSYGIKYWSIGNEPDLYADQGVRPAGYSAADYCATFREYATAMRAVDPTIKLVGPELSYRYTPGDDWLTPFLEGCKDLVDVVSVHRYPFPAEGATMEAAFADAARYRQVLRALRGILDRQGMADVPLAITEAHITWDADPAKSTQSASPQTFYAGMWVADVLGVAIEEGVWTTAFWQIGDRADGWYFAFIMGGQPMPSYHAMALVSQHFAGRVLTAGGVPDGFSVYASHDDSSGRTAVMVLNKNASPARLGIAVDASAPEELTFPERSLSMVVFAADGTVSEITRYTSQLAASGFPPEIVVPAR